MYSQRRNRSIGALGIGVLLGVGILAGAGIALHAQQTGSLATLDTKFKNLAGIGIKDLVGLRRDKSGAGSSRAEYGSSQGNTFLQIT